MNPRGIKFERNELLRWRILRSLLRSTVQGAQSSLFEETADVFTESIIPNLLATGIGEATLTKIYRHAILYRQYIYYISYLMINNQIHNYPGLINLENSSPYGSNIPL